MITLRGIIRYEVVALLLAAALVGCSRSPGGINTTYGRRSGNGASSVNGTSVFARMFQNAGHRVTSRGRSGGKIEDCKVIVWAPNRFTPPTKEERNVIQSWLGEEPGRTFIYIGRDYDASIEYWQHAADGLLADESSDALAGANQAEEYLRRRAQDMARFETARANIPKEEDAVWFDVSRDHPRQEVKNFEGPWSNGVDPAAASIWIRSQFDVPEESTIEGDPYYFNERSLAHEVLLSATGDAESDDDPFDESGGIRTADAAPLITRVTHPYWDDGAIVVVTNGSFLLNLPLVNHEHRKLAARIIDECGYEKGRVAFWDSDTFAPADATAEQHHPWKILTIWPPNFIILHLGVLGVLYIMWKCPIFGPAKELPGPATSDFAHHINAMGQLMAATNEAGYARAKLQNYRVHVRGDARDTDKPLAKSPKLDAASLEFQNSEAMAEYRRGDFSEALRLVNQMLDDQPQRSVLWQFKGECLFRLQRFDEALTSFQQLQTVGGPQAEEAFLWVSLCHHNASRTREAKTVLEQFISGADENVDPELFSKAKAALGKLQSAAKAR